MPVPLENDPPVLNAPTVGVGEYVDPYRAPLQRVSYVYYPRHNRGWI